MPDTIKQIQDMIEEYADNKEDSNSEKVAGIIYRLVIFKARAFMMKGLDAILPKIFKT